MAGWILSHLPRLWLSASRAGSKIYEQGHERGETHGFVCSCREFRGLMVVDHLSPVDDLC